MFPGFSSENLAYLKYGNSVFFSESAMACSTRLIGIADGSHVGFRQLRFMMFFTANICPVNNPVKLIRRPCAPSQIRQSIVGCGWIREMTCLHSQRTRANKRFEYKSVNEASGPANGDGAIASEFRLKLHPSRPNDARLMTVSLNAGPNRTIAAGAVTGESGYVFVNNRRIGFRHDGLLQGSCVRAGGWVTSPFACLHFTSCLETRNSADPTSQVLSA